TEESWELIKILVLYDHESWNDLRDLAKSVKAISFPQNIPNTSDRRLIELENQVQHLMEAHLAPKPYVQVNKIDSSCEICGVPMTLKFTWEIPSKLLPITHPCVLTKREGLVSNSMSLQDARLSKFKADFKQQQSEMTNKIETFLKAIHDRMMGALPSDMVKNPILNVNPISLVSSARSYPTEDPQSSSRPFNLINAIKTNTKPKGALEDEFKDFHLKLPVLEVLAHAPMYNAILDKYVESLELGKNRTVFIQGEMLKKMKDLELFTLHCRLGDSKPFDTLADLGSCVNLIPLYLFKTLNVGILEETENVLGLADGTRSYIVGIGKNVEEPTCPLLVGRGFLATASAVIDYRKVKIAVGEGVTRSIFGVKEIGLGIDFMKDHLPGELEIAMDAKLIPFKDVLVFRKMVEFLGAIPINLKGNMWELEDLIEKKINWKKPPKEGDGAWHIRIGIIDPDGEKFDRTFQSIPTTRKLCEKERPSDIIYLKHFHDT
ncbi:MAK10-like protein, partial [Tanacetum coccineum]